MKQQTYNIIANCIQYGAPALANELMEEFNQSVTNDNTLIQQRIAAEQARKEADAKAEAEKAKQAEQKVLDNHKK